MPKTQKCFMCQNHDVSVITGRIRSFGQGIIKQPCCDSCFQKIEHPLAPPGLRGSSAASSGSMSPPASMPAAAPSMPSPVPIAPGAASIPPLSAPAPMVASVSSMPPPAPMPAGASSMPPPAPMPAGASSMPPPAPVGGFGATAVGLDTTWTTTPPLTLAFEMPNVATFEIDWQNIDLSVIPPLQNAHSITVGDLHGNTLTLLIILIKSGILDLNRADFDIACNLIKNISILTPPHPTRLDWTMYEQFCNLLERGTVTGGARPTLRLLGDILADRMSNDALTLEVIGFLSRNHYPLICMLGNHDLEFFRGLYAAPSMLPAYTINRAYATSNINFLIFVRDHVTTPERKNRLVDNIERYIRYLCLFDCSLYHSQSVAGYFTIYSHASFHPTYSLVLMKALVQDSLNVVQNNYAQFTPVALKNLIDHANYALCTLLAEIFFIWRDDPNHTNLPNPSPIEFLDGLFHYSDLRLVLWCRIGPNTDLHIPVDIARPLPMLSTFRMRNIHGHDEVCRRGDLTLDSQVGKDQMYYFRGPQRLPIIFTNAAAAAPTASPPSAPPPIIPINTTGVP